MSQSDGVSPKTVGSCQPCTEGVCRCILDLAMTPEKSDKFVWKQNGHFPSHTRLLDRGDGSGVKLTLRSKACSTTCHYDNGCPTMILVNAIDQEGFWIEEQGSGYRHFLMIDQEVDLSERFNYFLNIWEDEKLSDKESAILNELDAKKVKNDPDKYAFYLLLESIHHCSTFTIPKELYPQRYHLIVQECDQEDGENLLPLPIGPKKPEGLFTKKWKKNVVNADQMQSLNRYYVQYGPRYNEEEKDVRDLQDPPVSTYFDLFPYFEYKMEFKYDVSDKQRSQEGRRLEMPLPYPNHLTLKLDAAIPTRDGGSLMPDWYAKRAPRIHIRNSWWVLGGLKDKILYEHPVMSHLSGEITFDRTILNNKAEQFTHKFDFYDVRKEFDAGGVKLFINDIKAAFNPKKQLAYHWLRKDVKERGGTPLTNFLESSIHEFYNRMDRTFDRAVEAYILLPQFSKTIECSLEELSETNSNNIYLKRSYNLKGELFQWHFEYEIIQHFLHYLYESEYFRTLAGDLYNTLTLRKKIQDMSNKPGPIINIKGDKNHADKVMQKSKDKIKDGVKDAIQESWENLDHDEIDAEIAKRIKAGRERREQRAQAKQEYLDITDDLPFWYRPFHKAMTEGTHIAGHIRDFILENDFLAAGNLRFMGNHIATIDLTATNHDTENARLTLQAEGENSSVSDNGDFASFETSGDERLQGRVALMSQVAVFEFHGIDLRASEVFRGEVSFKTEGGRLGAKVDAQHKSFEVSFQAIKTSADNKERIPSSNKRAEGMTYHLFEAEADPEEHKERGEYYEIL